MDSLSTGAYTLQGKYTAGCTPGSAACDHCMVKQIYFLEIIFEGRFSSGPLPKIATF